MSVVLWLVGSLRHHLVARFDIRLLNNMIALALLAPEESQADSRGDKDRNGDCECHLDTLTHVIIFSPAIASTLQSFLGHPFTIFVYFSTFFALIFPVSVFVFATSATTFSLLLFK